MRPRFKTIGAIGALLCAPAWAEPPDRLSARDLQTELFGTHQWGLEENSGLLVDECIEPSGRTVYRTREDARAAPYSEPGELAITADGLACFTYPGNLSPGPHCFIVFRKGAGYVFQSTDGAARFVIDRVDRGVQRCPPSGVFLSQAMGI